jgi:hypothetical protein
MRALIQFFRQLFHRTRAVEVRRPVYPSHVRVLRPDELATVLYDQDEAS